MNHRARRAAQFSSNISNITNITNNSCKYYLKIFVDIILEILQGEKADSWTNPEENPSWLVGNAIH